MKNVYLVLMIILLAGLPTAQAQTGAVEYEYDALGRLDRVIYTEDNSVIEYTYDENGNRTEVLIQRAGETSVEPEVEGGDGASTDSPQIIVVPNGSGGYSIIAVGG